MDTQGIMIDNNRPRKFAAFSVVFCFLLLIAFPSEVLAQEVAGTVTDAETGEPIPGANVVVAETNIGTTTNVDGEYSLDLPSDDVALLFSFVGYVQQEVPVDGRSQIDVALEEAIGVLDDLVVIGYGAAERRTVTTSISSVENVDLDQQPIGETAVGLVGRMAGVDIRQTRNILGSEPVIRVRGPSSISASNDPLVVIDGFPGRSLSDVNMNDIESVEVLKDASAAAIYGSRGAGGVIIVTTKSGIAGDKPEFSFNSHVGMQYPMTHGEDAWVSGGQEYQETLTKYINREWIWIGGDPDIPMWGDDRRPAHYQVNPVVAEGNHNWESILFSPAPIQNYNLSVSGASDGVNYYVSGAYSDQVGVLPNNWHKRYSLRANVLLDITENISADFRLNPSYRHQRNRSDSGIHNSIKMPPFVPPTINEETGRYYAPRDFWGHRISGMNSPLDRYEGSHYYSDSFRNIAEAKFGIGLLQGLRFETTLGATLQYNTWDNFAERRNTASGNTSGNAGDTRSMNLLNENVLSYNTTFNDVHNISSVLGASYQRENSRWAGITALTNSFQNEIIRTINNAEAAPWSGTSKTSWGLASYFGRINYDYDQRYMLSLSYRTDGSSRFGPQNRWGTFPAASAGWVISEENFMQDVDFLSELRLRASYGVVGNFGIGNFQYLGSISNVSYVLDGQLATGAAQTSFGNEELRWETTASTGFGVDLGLFDDRVNFVFDYYDQDTSDLLYNVSIPAVAGFSNTMVNVGDINNRGIELELNTINLQGDFTWESSVVFSRNRNKVTSLHADVNEIINTHSRGMGWILRVGEPMFSYYGYEMIGVHKDEASFDEHPHKPGAPLGSAIYRDQNNDGVIDERDRVILGNFMPDFEWGMTHNFYWNNFDLGFTLQSKVGGLQYNFESLWYQGATVSAFLRPSIEGQWWSPDDPGTGAPATSLANLDYVSDTDYYLEPADFLAVRNINFGYTLPSSLVERAGVDRFRLYLSIQNAFMFTSSDYIGYNPEGMTAGEISGTGSLPGYNTGAEPMNRTIVLGINMNF